jgi:hypothetical protein
LASFVLGPYELRSFSVGSEIEVAGFRAQSPEPIVTQLRSEAEYQEAAADAIRQADPLKRPVRMYDPGDRVVGTVSQKPGFLEKPGFFPSASF